MELYQLKYFAYAARYENISMAAQELHVSQPSVSKAIKALEKELQVELMQRNGKSCSLTREGRLLQTRVQMILEEVKKLPELVSNQNSRRIICINALSGILLVPEIIRKFRVSNPNVYFTILDQRETISWDFCIRSTLPEVYFNNATMLMSERFRVAFCEDSPLRNRQVLTLDDLRNETFVVLKPGGSIRTICDKIFKELGFIPKETFTVEDFYVVKRMIQEGMGVTIWPQYSWRESLEREETYSGICFRDIDIPGFFRSLYLIRQKNIKMDGVLSAFSDFVIDYFRTVKT